MKLSHRELVEREARLPAGHRNGWDGYRAALRDVRDRFFHEYRQPGRPPQPGPDEIIAAFDDCPPVHFTEPYNLSDEDIAALEGVVQKKYVVRFKNIRRSWAILLQFMPELMVDGGPPRDVLEMSTAHGATLEILRDKGHRVVGNDFPNFLGHGADADSRFRRIGEIDLTELRDDHGLHSGGAVADWPYRPIIESLGLDVRLFDAGALPYPFDDRAFDTVLCFDAIEHYCHPLDWMRIVEEFCRLARRSVLLITNPVMPHFLENEPYMEAFYDFQRRMRTAPPAGFMTAFASVHRNQLTVYKLCREG